MTTTPVPGVQRPHPTFGEVVILLLPTFLSMVSVTLIGLTILLTTLPATVFGCKTMGRLFVSATMADLTLKW